MKQGCFIPQWIFYPTLIKSGNNIPYYRLQIGGAFNIQLVIKQLNNLLVEEFPLEIPFYPLEIQSFVCSHFSGEYKFKGEKQIQNLTEITIAPTATHFRPTAQIRTLQPRMISMNKRL